MYIVDYVCYAALGIVTLIGMYLIYQYRSVVAMSEGTQQMINLAAKIRSGAKVFTRAMYKKIIIAAIILAGIICFFVEHWAGLAFLVGLACTTISVLVGMSVATYANVRAAAVALKGVEDDEDEPIVCARTVNATVKASQICGLIVQSSALLGLSLVVLVSGKDSFYLTENALIIPIVARLTAYSLGWSIVAMFCRVAGGIFTKAADIGADLIGKVFMHFEEDDHRNPAVVADFVGDNVNDIDGNQADLGESFTATPVTTIVTAINMYGRTSDPAMLALAVAYPFILALGGLVSSLVGLYYASHAKESDDPGKQINASMYIAASGALITSLVASYCLFGKGITPADFRFGWSSPFWSTICGVIAGVGIGKVAQHYTDLESKWAERVSEIAKSGSALCASLSQAAGWMSCFAEIAIVAILSYAAAIIAGPYGRSVMALGMLAFVAQPIGADAFGPISDNAGGIAESCELPHKVRIITDKNDAYGNSSAAVGKGFAIGSAGAVVLSQITTYVAAYGGNSLDFVRGEVMFGGFMGVALMALFCGLLAYYTIVAAGEMAEECKKQFKDPDVASGKKDPDSDACIHIATINALKKMLTPVAIAVSATIFIGFVFGPETMGGVLVGVELIGLPLAIYFSNAGGLADNAKKRYEANLVKGFERGTEGYNAAHDAAVVGDTMGDWMKDVVAVSVDIFMKIMGTLALMLAPLFAAYQIFQIM